jgi:hypothetical protein
VPGLPVGVIFGGTFDDAALDDAVLERVKPDLLAGLGVGGENSMGLTERSALVFSW